MKKTKPLSAGGQAGVGGRKMRHQEHNTLSMPSQPSSVQRQRILARLRIGPATTLQLRNELHAMHPAARVLELRRAGHEIVTTRLPNRVGVYHLVGEAGHD